MTKKSSSINEYLRKRAEVKEVASVNSNNITKKKTPTFWKGSFQDREGSKYSRCYICGSQVKFEQNMLERHWKRYHSEAPEDQVIAVEEGGNPYDVIELLIESKSIENGLKLFCKICGKTDNRADLKRHVDANHVSGAIYACKGCSNIFRLDQDLQRHMTRCIGIIPKEVKPKAKERGLICYKSKSMMEQNKEGFMCKVCGITTKKQRSMARHVRSVHIEVKHICSLCENQISYSSKKELAEHVIEIHSY